MSTITTGDMEPEAIRSYPWIHAVAQALIPEGPTYPVVGYIDCLWHKPDPETANQMLEYITEVLRPIMASNHYRIDGVCELYSMDPKVTTMVRHEDIGRMAGTPTILIRLRDASDHDQFLALDDVVDSMLIELAKLNFPKPDQAREHQELTRKLQSEYAAYHGRLEVRRYRHPTTKAKETLTKKVKVALKGFVKKLFKL
ncbi:hypothetical protein DFP73DRAFT_593582 [Morchella snyderi]|nr:hypothetical protein DFP73DRAFT_593582 [Morchella snyderi]